MPAAPDRQHYRLLSVESQILADNLLGDPCHRLLPVYLPPHYEREPQRRFPVVFSLAGYGGWGAQKLAEKSFEEPLHLQLDRWMDGGILEPMIVAFPDCFTRFGGAQYRNSMTTGHYQDHLSQELVALVDRELRTVAHRDFRGAIGHSSGGYGALLLGMDRPEVFGHICSTAGDGYFALTYPLDLGKAFQQFRRYGGPAEFARQFLSKRQRGGTEFGAMSILAYAQAYSADPQVPEVFCQLPFDLQTGELRQEVWQQWLSCDPLQLCGHHREQLRSLHTLYLDAGISDEWCLDVATRVLSSRLKSLEIPHIHEEFDGGHMGCGWRIEASLAQISASLRRLASSPQLSESR